jgi:hypothetical protein
MMQSDQEVFEKRLKTLSNDISRLVFISKKNSAQRRVWPGEIRDERKGRMS